MKSPLEDTLPPGKAGIAWLNRKATGRSFGALPGGMLYVAALAGGCIIFQQLLRVTGKAGLGKKKN